MFEESDLEADSALERISVGLIRGIRTGSRGNLRLLSSYISERIAKSGIEKGT